MLRPLLITLVLGVVLPVSASAIPVRWEVQAFLQGGATITGSFTIDVDTEQVWDIDLTSTPGPGECRIDDVSIDCDMPGAYYSGFWSMNFYVSSEGRKHLSGFAFLSDGPLADAYTWQARFEPRFDGECTGSNRPSNCYGGPGNEGGSWEILEISKELQCGGPPACRDPMSLRSMVYLGRDENNRPYNFMVGTVVPLPAAAWLFGSALGVMGWMRRIVSHPMATNHAC